MKQMTIFDLITPVIGWKEMSEMEIGDYIANHFGKVARVSSFMGCEFEVDGLVVCIRKSRYSAGVNGGEEMIAIDVAKRNRTAGIGCPCDSLDEAISRIEYGVSVLKND